LIVLQQNLNSIFALRLQKLSLAKRCMPYLKSNQKMNKEILILLLSFLIISCSNDRNSTPQQNNIEQTPEALNEDRKLDISSYRKRYDSDIIKKLFDEAVENNDSLKSLTSNLEKAKEFKSDSLESYQTYKRNNLTYWNALTRYSNQISDSTLKNELIVIIESLKDKHSKRTAPLDELASRIDSTEQALGDLEILMKIVVTEPMMGNYQRNEYPDIKTLEAVKEVLDSSITQIKPYTKIQK